MKTPSLSITHFGGLTDRLWETVEVQARYISELNARLTKVEAYVVAHP